MSLAATWRRITAYFDHPDPRAAIGGTIALVVLGNQPFYPFYVAYAAGGWIAPAFATWLSSPFFAIAPALARRSPDAGRAMVVAAALGNTILTAVALGPATGVEAFYIPCVLLAGLVFPPGRRRLALAAALAAVAAGIVLARLGAPWATLTPAQNHALAVMHGISVACITGLLPVIAWRRLP